MSKPVKQEAAPPARAEFAILKREAAEMRELMEANLGQGGMNPYDLDKIKAPSGGALFWTIHTLEGEEAVKELEVILLHWRDVRRYYARGLEESGGGSPPDCRSEDTVRGFGTPGGSCLSCPLAQMGSDPKGGKGQACKERRMLFVVRPGGVLPDLLELPTTSLKPVRDYFKRLASAGHLFYGLRTKVGLKAAQNEKGIKYSEAVFAAGEPLAPDELAAVKAMRAALLPVLDAPRGAGQAVAPARRALPQAPPPEEGPERQDYSPTYPWSEQ